MVRIPPNVTELHLKVTDGGDGVAFDQADWAEAAFVMKDGSRRMLDEGQLDLPMAEDGLPLRFLYGGRSSDELLREWHKSRSVKDEGAWTRMLCRWDEPGDGLSMTVDARLFHRYGAVEWVVYFENRGPRDSAVLEEVWPLHLTLASAFFRLPVVLHHLNGDTCSAESFLPFTTPLEPGKGLRLTPTGGRPSSMTAFPFWNLQYRDGGIITAIGWTGQWAAEMQRDPRGPTTLRAGQETLRTVLRPGERIRTPRILILPWKGDRWDAHRRFRRLMFEHFTPKFQGKMPVPPLAIQCFDRYHSTEGWATEAGQLAYARVGHDLGFDSVWLDAAWFPGGFPNGVGTWSADPAKFPRGLKPVADAIHAQKQRFILWFEPERVAKGSEIAREHPEWVFGGSEGGLFKLNDGAAREWLKQLIIRRIREYGVDVYRNDFNIDPLPYWRSADEPNRQGMTEVRYVEGLYELWDSIRTAVPGVLIDNCASGGRRLDLEMLMRSVPLWRSDTGCSPGHPEWNQVQTMSLAQYLPLFTVGLWSPEPYERRSAATAGVPMEVPYLNVGFQGEPYATAVREIEAFRKYWFGDFYPVCGHGLGQDQFVVWQLHRPDLNEGAVYGFRRPDCGLAGVVLPLRGITPDKTYLVEFFEDGGPPRKQGISGKQLLQGLTVTISRRGGSTLVRYGPVPEVKRSTGSKRAP